MDSDQAKRAYSKAGSLYQEKRYLEALAILDEIDQETPSQKEVTYARALCLMSLGRHEEARGVCERMTAVLGDPRGEQLMAKLAARTSPGPQAPPTAARASGPRRWNRSAIVGAVIVGCAAAVLILFVGLKRTPQPSNQLAAPLAQQPPRPTAQDEVVVTFPGNPVGDVSIFKDGAWNRFAQAQGAVTLSKSKAYALKVMYGTKDLSFLASVDAGAPITQLAITVAPDDENLEYVGHLALLEGFEANGEKITQAGLGHLARLTRLKRLALPSLKIGRDTLAPLAGLTSLECLEFLDCEVLERGLAPLANLPGLKELNLYRAKLAPGDVEDIAKVRSLENLYLAQLEIHDEDLKPLGALASLRQLDLQTTPITGPGLAYLNGLTSLQQLDIGQTGTDDNAAGFLAQLSGLRELFLWSTRISDETLKQLPALKSLEHLDLRWTAITDAGIEHLNGVPTLKMLELEGCEKISRPAVDALAGVLPGCSITGGPLVLVPQGTMVATNAAGDQLEVIAFDPPLPANLPLNENITVHVAYELRSADSCRLAAQPLSKEGARGSYMPLECSRGAGKTEVRCFFGSSTVVDKFRIFMYTSTETVLELTVDGQATWGKTG